jgi:hypothetical protein
LLALYFHSKFCICISKQVYFLDVDTIEGKNVQTELDEELGKGFALFYSCEVANTDQFKGIIPTIWTTCLIVVPAVYA